MQADLLSHFKTLKDPRIDRTKRYPLIEIIFLIISGTLSGCEGWKSIRDFGVLKLEWLRQVLPYENGIPVDDTLARVMRKLDTKQFANCLSRWLHCNHRRHGLPERHSWANCQPERGLPTGSER